MSKLSKEETKYSLGMKNSHCGKVFKDDRGYCKHFIKDNRCEIVEGQIDPVYWCNKFEKP